MTAAVLLQLSLSISAVVNPLNHIIAYTSLAAERETAPCEYTTQTRENQSIATREVKVRGGSRGERCMLRGLLVARSDAAALIIPLASLRPKSPHLISW